MIGSNKSFISQTSKIVSLLGRKLYFFSFLWGFKIQGASVSKTSKIKFGRSLKWYLEEKYLISDLVQPTIHQFCAKNFDSDFGSHDENILFWETWALGNRHNIPCPPCRLCLNVYYVDQEYISNVHFCKYLCCKNTAVIWPILLYSYFLWFLCNSGIGSTPVAATLARPTSSDVIQMACYIGLKLRESII